MVYIQAVKKRGFLRQIAEGAKRSTSTLKEALVSGQANCFSANFQKGRLLVSTSGSGQSGSFEIAVQGKEFTQDNVFALFEELIEVLDATVAAGLAVDSGVSIDTDTLFTAMCQDDRLVGVRTEMGDYTSLNVPSLGGIPAQ
jgi:hypothetical protein